jgi:hypothetical protein
MLVKLQVDIYSGVRDTVDYIIYRCFNIFALLFR